MENWRKSRGRVLEEIEEEVEVTTLAGKKTEVTAPRPLLSL